MLDIPQNDNSGTKLMAGIMVLLILMFLATCLMVYDLRGKNKNLQEQLQSIDSIARENITFINQVLDIQKDDYSNLNNHISQQKEQLSLLEESIEGKDKRWARIKRVRDAIDNITTLSLTIEERTTIASAVVASSEEFDISASLILGMIRTESNFSRRITSHAGAQGLMQLMPSTATEIKDWLNVRYFNPWRAKDNIRFGSSYIARMLHIFEDNEELATKAYNCGSLCVTRVESGEWSNYPEETQAYYPKVMKYQSEFIDQGVNW